MMKEKVLSIDPDHILHKDQTPIPFSYHSKNTSYEGLAGQLHPCFYN